MSDIFEDYKNSVNEAIDVVCVFELSMGNKLVDVKTIQRINITTNSPFKKDAWKKAFEYVANNYDMDKSIITLSLIKTIMPIK